MSRPRQRIAEVQVRIRNRSGLHARPAAVFHDLANTFRAEVTVLKDGLRADGKSLIEILSLGAERGAEVMIRAEGEDAEAAVQALVSLIQSGFGEK